MLRMTQTIVVAWEQRCIILVTFSLTYTEPFWHDTVSWSTPLTVPTRSGLSVHLELAGKVGRA